jgi:hypothetical protein
MGQLSLFLAGRIYLRAPGLGRRSRRSCPNRCSTGRPAAAEKRNSIITGSSLRARRPIPGRSATRTAADNLLLSISRPDRSRRPMHNKLAAPDWAIWAASSFLIGAQAGRPAGGGRAADQLRPSIAIRTVAVLASGGASSARAPTHLSCANTHTERHLFGPAGLASQRSLPGREIEISAAGQTSASSHCCVNQTEAPKFGASSSSSSRLRLRRLGLRLCGITRKPAAEWRGHWARSTDETARRRYENKHNAAAAQ